MRRRYYATNAKVLPFIAPYDTDGSKTQYCDEDGIFKLENLKYADNDCDTDLLKTFNRYKTSESSYILGFTPNVALTTSLPINTNSFIIGYTTNKGENIIEKYNKDDIAESIKVGNNILKRYTFPENTINRWIIGNSKNLITLRVGYDTGNNNNNVLCKCIFTTTEYINAHYNKTLKYVYITDNFKGFNSSDSFNQTTSLSGCIYIHNFFTQFAYINNLGLNINTNKGLTKVIIDTDKKYYIPCYSIENVELKPNATTYEYKGNILIHKDNDTISAIYCRRTNNDISEEVNKTLKECTNIGPFSFCYTTISDITIPKQVITIQRDCFAYSQIQKCKILGGSDKFTSAGYPLNLHSTFNYSKIKEVYFGKNIKQIYYAFYNCACDLYYIDTFDDYLNTTFIQHYASCPFWNGQLYIKNDNDEYDVITEVDTTNHNGTLSAFLFYNLSSITKVIIGENVTSIGTECFKVYSSNGYNRSNITECEIRSNAKYIYGHFNKNCVFTLGNNIIDYTLNDGVLIYKNTNLVKVSSDYKVNEDYTIPNDITIIEEGCFNGTTIAVLNTNKVNTLSKYCLHNYGKVIIGEGVTQIPSMCIYTNNDIELPSTITRLIYYCINSSKNVILKATKRPTPNYATFNYCPNSTWYVPDESYDLYIKNPYKTNSGYQIKIKKISEYPN